MTTADALPLDLDPRDARRLADSLAAAAVREARGLIRDAIDVRRSDPARFARFHEIMADYHARRALTLPRRAQRSRARVAERWHRWLGARYKARALALEPRTCAALWPNAGPM